jgi:hypothetical protein
MKLPDEGSGMKRDSEVLLMRRERAKGRTQEQAAARAGMSVRTLRRYERRGKLPSQFREPADPARAGPRQPQPCRGSFGAFVPCRRRPTACCCARSQMAYAGPHSAEATLRDAYTIHRQLFGPIGSGNRRNRNPVVLKSSCGHRI